MIDNFIFYPRKNNSYFEKKWKCNEVIFEVGHQRLQGWFIKTENFKNDPIIIYFGGNAEDISCNLSYLEVKQQASILLLNYRGFGKSSGKPSQNALFADAVAVYDHLINSMQILPENIYLIGRSIGSSIAAYVASKRKTAGLVLITPFDSVANLAARKYKLLPLKFFLKSSFNTIEYLKAVKEKILIIAAEKDEVIPKKCLDNLVKKFHSNLDLLIIKDADHQNVADFDLFHEAICNYIKSK